MAATTENAFVHELGHVLIDRANVIGNNSGSNTFYGLVEKPLPTPVAGSSALGAGGFIFGPRGIDIYLPTPSGNSGPTPTSVRLSDWQRGDRGWGTGSDLLTAPTYQDIKPAYEIGATFPLPTEIYVGPCITGSPGDRGLPTQYQQNPCHVKDWVIRNPGWYSTPMPNLGPILETEIEETAADMFLNWVYDNQGGFENKVWQNRATYVVDSLESGDARSDWMNCALTRMFNLKSFWQTSNTLFNFPTTSAFECQRFPGLLAYDQQ